MINSSYRIFKPEPTKGKLSRSELSFGLWAFGVILFYIVDEFFQPTDLYRNLQLIYLLGVLALTFYWTLISFWNYEPLNGKLEGDLQFSETSFAIDGQVVQLKDLLKLDINGMDYYGKRQMWRNIEPQLSQGVGNFIEFTCLNHSSTKVYFKQVEERQYRNIRPFIISAIQLNKISFLRGIELLDIADYDEIQAFKKELAIPVAVNDTD